MGNRFGFVRFSGTVNQVETLEKLNIIWIGSFVIRAFIPKFGRSLEAGGDRVIERTREGEKSKPYIKVLASGKKVGGVSYSEALAGLTNRKRESPEEGGVEIAEGQILYQSEENDNKWLSGALTGLLMNYFSWKEHGEELQNECSGSLTITDMGSNILLIQSATNETASVILKGYDEWEKFWLSWCRPWEYTEVNQRRIVWTRWVGVPLQAWSLKFFCLGCANFGSLIEMHEVTKSRNMLDEVFIRISTGLDTIDRSHEVSS